MKYLLSKSLLSRAWFLPLIWVISSCGSDPNLAKIRQFSQLADRAEKELPQITNDMYISCLKEARYRAISLLPPNLNDPNERSVTSRLQDRVKDQEKCDASPSSPLELSSLMDSGNSIIIAYMKKLGQIASNDLLNFDPEFNRLKASSQNLSGELTTLFGATQESSTTIQNRVSAGVNLFKLIVQGILEGKRTQTLKEVISIANQPLATYAEGLQIVVERVYIGQYLSAEEMALNNYYIDYIGDIGDRKLRANPPSSININTLLTLEDRWNSEKDKIQQRRQVGRDYIELLQQIVASHDQLAKIYDSGRSPSSQELTKMIEKNTKSLEKFVRSSEKVFPQK